MIPGNGGPPGCGFGRRIRAAFSASIGSRFVAKPVKAQAGSPERPRARGHRNLSIASINRIHPLDAIGRAEPTLKLRRGPRYR